MEIEIDIYNYSGAEIHGSEKLHIFTGSKKIFCSLPILFTGPTHFLPVVRSFTWTRRELWRLHVLS